MKFKKYINEVYGEHLGDETTEEDFTLKDIERIFKGRLTEILPFSMDYYNPKFINERKQWNIFNNTIAILGRTSRFNKRSSFSSVTGERYYKNGVLINLTDEVEKMGLKIKFTYNEYDSGLGVIYNPNLKESLDKLSDAVNKIIKDMQRKGHVRPGIIADRVRKALELDLSRKQIIARYFGNLGGSFESEV